MYCCPIERPGYLPQPYHLPGYGGHVPSIRQRNGATFGRLSRDCIEDPCVAQAPCPVLAPPPPKCCPPPSCCRNPVGCEDIGCCDPVCCPPPRINIKPRKPKCEEIPCDPCKIMECFPPAACCPRPRPCCPPPPCCPSAPCRPSPACCSLPRAPPPPCCPLPCGPPPCCPSPCGPPLCCPPPRCIAPPPCCPPPCPPRPSCGASSMRDPCDDPCCGPPEAPCPIKQRNHLPEPAGFVCGPDVPPCCESAYAARAHHINRGPYACPCKPEPDNNVYRCCESMSSSYAGHIPGFTFHSNGRTTGKATWGTKQYMNKCFYFNTFSKP